MFTLGERVYLEVLVDNKQVNCLLDTGSEITLIPASLVQHLTKKSVTSQIRAANGTTIEVLGLVDLSVLLKGRELLIRGVASDQIGEMLLGIDWFKEQRAVWDMRNGNCICMVQYFPLKPSETGVGFAGSWCKRPSIFSPAARPTC